MESLSWKLCNGGADRKVLGKWLPLLIFEGYILLVLFEQFPDVVASRYDTRYIKPRYSWFFIFNKDKVPVRGSSYCVKNKGKQPLSLAVFFKMAGELAEHITLFASWYCGSPTLQKTSLFFWKLFFQPLKTESIACQEGRHEARRTIRFWMIFLHDP